MLFNTPSPDRGLATTIGRDPARSFHQDGWHSDGSAYKAQQTTQQHVAANIVSEGNYAIHEILRFDFWLPQG